MDYIKMWLGPKQQSVSKGKNSKYIIQVTQEPQKMYAEFIVELQSSSDRACNGRGISSADTIQNRLP